MLRAFLLGLSLSTAMVGTASADGDAAKGEALFKKKCTACHQTAKPTNGVGPHMIGIFGRKSGTVDGFTRYSAKFKELNLVWDEDNLEKWLSDPKAMAPGTAMNILGGNIKDEDEREDIIAYLKTLKAS